MVIVKKNQLIQPRLVLNSGISGHQCVHRFVGGQGARFVSRIIQYILLVDPCVCVSVYMSVRDDLKVE